MVRIAIRIIFIVVGLGLIIAGASSLYVERTEYANGYDDFMASVERYETELRAYKNYQQEFEEWRINSEQGVVPPDSSLLSPPQYSAYTEPPPVVKMPDLPLPEPAPSDYVLGVVFAFIGGCLLIVSSLRYLDKPMGAGYTVRMQKMNAREISNSEKKFDESVVIPGLELAEISVSALPFWLYFVAFITAELLTALLQPVAGVICHGIILVVLLVQSAFTFQSRHRNLIVSLSLVPLVRIMSLSMPLANLPLTYWYILIYVPLLVAAIIVMRIVGLTTRQVGLIGRGLPIQVGVGIFSGIALGILEYYILRPQPLISEFSFRQIWLPAIVLLMTTGFVEELIFRGVLQQTSGVVMGRLGVVYISAVFAILHIGHLSIFDVGFVFAIALFFAALVKRTGSLIGVTLSHGLTNIFLYLIAPFILT